MSDHTNFHDARNSTPLEQRLIRAERILEAVEGWAREKRAEVERGHLPSQSLHEINGRTTTMAFDRELIRLRVKIIYETEAC